MGGWSIMRLHVVPFQYCQRALAACLMGNGCLLAVDQELVLIQQRHSFMRFYAVPHPPHTTPAINYATRQPFLDASVDRAARHPAVLDDPFHRVT